ncbi:MAG: 3-deoxy-D-manno-octulosonic acid kinase [Gammaproteobacteria bacterium]|nr:3-deoxy-D-manno-octulosonic acid kinase [Gammaproteobacteria bacterium]NVK86972.1 3-deoxy-D-manno-octulosonic acid kinase [Gammaproteobacteria bacterium]
MLSSEQNPQKHWLIASENCPQQLSEQWFNADYWRTKKAIMGESRGRSTTYFIDSQSVAGKAPFVLRHYCRGGLYGKINYDRFLYLGIERTRPYRELELLEKMVAMELPVPHPVAGHVWQRGGFYQADILIEQIPASKDAYHHLCIGELEQDVWHAIGTTIAAFHRQQVFHSDLNIHNILLDEQAKVWLIDFDKCALRAGDQWKAENLARLHRSLTKEKTKQPNFHFTEQDWQVLLSGYQQGG